MQQPAQEAATSAAPSPETALHLYRHMVRLRLLSAQMVELQRDGKIGFHASSIGDEAAVAAAALAARPNDWLFPGVREWGAAVVRGLPIVDYVHHAHGSARDAQKGHASPDHPAARALKVAPASGIVGAHLVQAAGAAWAARTRKDDVVAIAMAGAGVTAGGDFHNALNFAGVFKAPVVFVLRNDGRTPREAIATKAVAYGIASATVDGADALAVLSTIREAVARTADGKGPTLIEVTTHPEAVEEKGGEHDPIARLAKQIAQSDDDAAARDARAEIEAAVAAAKDAPPPPRASMFENVYAEVPPHLAAQRDAVRDATRDERDA